MNISSTEWVMQSTPPPVVGEKDGRAPNSALVDSFVL